MSTRLKAHYPYLRTTDHSVEIAEMSRVLKEEIMDAYPEIEQANTLHTFKQSTLLPGSSTLTVLWAGTVLMTGITMLQRHDETGISLDNWDGPRELVIMALNLCGYEDEVFLENGV